MALHEDDVTTLVCLFHSRDTAQATADELAQIGVAPDAIVVVGGPEAADDAFEKSELASLGMPDKDYDRLKEGVRGGGVVLGVRAVGEAQGKIENVFMKHNTEKIDEARIQYRYPVVGAVALDDGLPVAPQYAAGYGAQSEVGPAYDEAETIEDALPVSAQERGIPMVTEAGIPGSYSGTANSLGETTIPAGGPLSEKNKI